MMNKLVEHVACCIGESVTGNPTQFVLERLAASKSDLRFFTAEVPPEKLAAAVEGIRALNFDAIVFLQDVALTNELTFETYSQSVLKCGFLNVAKRIRSSWIADNIDGPTIASYLSHHQWSGEIVVYSEIDFAELLRIAAPDLHDKIVVLQPDAIEAEQTPKMEPTTSDTNEPKLRRLNRNQLSEAPLNCGILLTDRKLTPLDASLLRASISDQTIAIDMSIDQNQSDRESLSVRWVGREELYCCKLCAMFEVMTGIKPDPNAVRELLDEFSSW